MTLAIIDHLNREKIFELIRKNKKNMEIVKLERIDFNNYLQRKLVHQEA